MNLPPLRELYLTQGAALAADGIPLHFGDEAAEYHAALHGAVLLDRSHEGRLLLTGRDRFELPNRMSTGQLIGLSAGQGRPTIFTNAHARILDRAVIYAWRDDSALLLTGPGRGPALADYLKRNIFFNDQVAVADLAAEFHHFALHGPQAQTVIAVFAAGLAQMSAWRGGWTSIDGADCFVCPLEPLAGSHWSVLVPVKQAAGVWTALLEAGRSAGLRPSGGLIYNALRVQAGRPGAGRELTVDYIPLEVGLWDEVSFNKGCYTGQEIIARMESRGKLAKTLVRLDLSAWAEAPQALIYEGRVVGTLTSAVRTPIGDIYAIGVVKTSLAQTGVALITASGVPATIGGLAGVQPAASADNASSS
jgi:aminomethyltransferase